MRKILFLSAVVVLVVFVLAGMALAVPVLVVNGSRVIQGSNPAAVNTQGVVQNVSSATGPLAVNNNTIPQWNVQNSTNNTIFQVNQNAPVGVSVSTEEWDYGVDIGIVGGAWGSGWWLFGGLLGHADNWGIDVDVDLVSLGDNEIVIDDSFISQTNAPAAANTQSVIQNAAAGNGVAINNNSTAQANLQTASNNVLIGVNQGFTPLP